MHGFRFQVRTLAARLMTRIRQSETDESGASSIEYSFIAALIAAIIVTVVRLIGQQLVPGLQALVGAF
jgi:Flp pilus assembly pilin Flp